MHDYEREHSLTPRQAPTFRAGSDLPFWCFCILTNTLIFYI
jgi:hypothetical protein